MKKNNGFTLLELLAIIIILGVIAVIVVPTVKTVTVDARKKAFEETAQGIIRAGDLYYSRKQMAEETINDTLFTFPNVSDELKLSGKLPKKGSMMIKNNGDIAIAVSNDEYCVTKAYKDKTTTVTEDVNNCEIPLDVGDFTYFNPVLNKKCEDYVKDNSTLGVKDGCLKWYVYKETDDSYGLILDHNTTGATNWNDTQVLADGPVAVMTQLQSDTANWTVPADIISLEDLLNIIPFYQNLENKSDWQSKYYDEFDVKYMYILLAIEVDYASGFFLTRLDTMEIAKDKIMEELPDYVLPNYLHNDLLDYCDTEAFACETTGYWTKDGYSSNMAYAVSYLGIIGTERITPINRAAVSLNMGVRPVITLNK